MANYEKVSNFWNLKSAPLQICVLLFLNYFILAYMRHSLGMAMVCMVNSTAVGLLPQSKSTKINVSNNEIGSCPVTSQLRKDYEGQFVWTTSQQGALFAAIYWGSLMSFPAGWISDRYNCKHVLTSALIINTIGSALTPLAAEYGGYDYLFVVRCFMGIGQGIFIPAVGAFVSRWIPQDERIIAVSIYTAGNQLAGVIGAPIGAWLCRTKWPYVFYSSAIFGFISALIWSFSVKNEPENNTHEKDCILSSTGIKKNKSIPWRSMITSLPVLACVVCNLADGLLTAASSSYLPTYFMEVLHLGLFTNGLYSSIPSAVQAVLKFVTAAIADRLRKSGRISRTTISKIFNSTGFVGPAIFLTACSFLTCQNGYLAVIFLSAGLGLFAATSAGFMTSQVALAPLYAGTVSSTTTTSFQIGSIIAPYFVGAITSHGSRQEWQIVFGTISVLLLAAGLFYLAFGSADVQEWSKIYDQSTKYSIPDVAAVTTISQTIQFISTPDIVPATVISLNTRV